MTLGDLKVYVMAGILKDEEIGQKYREAIGAKSCDEIHPEPVFYTKVMAEAAAENAKECERVMVRMREIQDADNAEWARKYLGALVARTNPEPDQPIMAAARDYQSKCERG